MTEPIYYSIVEAEPRHLEEICLDLRYQQESGISTCPLFFFAAVPEGTPAVDKASAFVERYLPFKRRLDEMGLPSGVLVQCTIGHGYPLNADSTFRKYVNLNDGTVQSTVCPSDPDFCAYIRRTMHTLAEAAPDVILVDDDFRLIFRPGNGCACSWHLDRVAELTGRRFTREALYAELSADGSGEIAEAYIHSSSEALLMAARAMRQGIDEVDPTLQGAFCGCGNNMEAAEEVAKLLAGEGNPVILRISNGTYYPAGNRAFTRDFYRAAIQVMHVRGKVDAILAESDTCPQNRYALSANWFHSHYVGTLLEGTVGAKRWITRLGTYEPESGVAYRRLLAKNRGFYDTLIRLVPTVTWQGCRVPLHPKKTYTFSACGWDSQNDAADGWVIHVLERMGLPVFYSPTVSGCTFFSGVIDKKMSDDELLSALRAPAVFSSDVALRLIQRGFGRHLGVEIRPWTGKRASDDLIYATSQPVAPQEMPMELVPFSDRVRIESSAVHTLDRREYTTLYPSTTVYENELGGTSIVFAGTPVTEYTYDHAFSFLCHSRKVELVKLLSNVGCLPVWYTEDAEVYCKAGYTDGGELLVALFNLSYDVLDEIPLGLERKAVSSVSYLTPSGEFAQARYVETELGITVERAALPMDPVVLLIRS